MCAAPRCGIEPAAGLQSPVGAARLERGMSGFVVRAAPADCEGSVERRAGRVASEVLVHSDPLGFGCTPLRGTVRRTSHFPDSDRDVGSGHSCTGCKAPSVFRGFGRLHYLLRAPPPACLVVDLTADQLPAGLRPFSLLGYLIAPNKEILSSLCADVETKLGDRSIRR